jgi:hypothetical protein
MPRFVDLASSGYEGYSIAQKFFDDIVAVLRGNPRFGDVSTAQFDLLLADLKRDVERRLVRALRCRVHIDDLGEDQ